jgi:hypothetical protein
MCYSYSSVEFSGYDCFSGYFGGIGSDDSSVCLTSGRLRYECHVGRRVPLAKDAGSRLSTRFAREM